MGESLAHSLSLSPCRPVGCLPRRTMSDDIDLRVIGAFTAVAAVQFGATARDVYRAWMNRNRKPKPTDYDRVINNGITINGWSVAVPAMAGLNKETNEMIIYGPVNPVIIDPDGKENPPTATDCSITLQFDHPDLNGLKIHSICQYSVFDATEKILFSMRYEPWKMKLVYSAFLTPTTILTAMRLRQETGNQKFQVITFNTKKPTSRSFQVEAPGEGMWIMCAYVSNRPKYQLHIIYYHNMEDEDEEARVEFFDCKCDDPFGNGAWTWESISFPLGNRSNHSWFYVGSAVVFVAIDGTSPMDTDAHMCITFDQSKTWQMETLTQWLESNRNEPINQAAQSFDALSPPIEWSRSDSPGLQYMNRLSPHGNSVLFITDCEGVLGRWTSPPSLLHLAIKALFQSNPGLKMEDLKMYLGVGMFEAIFEESGNSVG